MSVYDDNAFLYDSEEEHKEPPELYTTTVLINNENVKGYTFTNHGKQYFVYRMSSNYHVNGRQWGNPWSVFNVTDNKIAISGRKTREKAIEAVLNSR